MTDMSRPFLGLIIIGVMGTLTTLPALAAAYAVHPRARYEVIDRGPNPYCGPRCGCPLVTFVRHRELVQYYPSGFDPRVREEEPHYSYGAIRTYARFERQNCPQ